jgi:hypothetical protein
LFDAVQDRFKSHGYDAVSQEGLRGDFKLTRLGQKT